jgi:hypothetical protein
VDKLLAERSAGQVRKLWPRNFVKRNPSLTTRFNQAYNYQRALREDPQVIQSWFELVARTKAKYGICDEDTHNLALSELTIQQQSVKRAKRSVFRSEGRLQKQRERMLLLKRRLSNRLRGKRVKRGLDQVLAARLQRAAPSAGRLPIIHRRVRSELEVVANYI